MIDYINLFFSTIGMLWILLGALWGLEKIISKKNQLTKHDLKNIGLTIPLAGLAMCVLFFFMDRNILGVLDLWNGRIAILIFAYVFGFLTFVAVDISRRIEGKRTVFHRSNIKNFILLPAIAGLLLLGLIELFTRL